MGSDFLFAATLLPVDTDGLLLQEFDRIENLVRLRLDYAQAIDPTNYDDAVFNLLGGDEDATEDEIISTVIGVLRDVVEGADRRDVATGRFHSDRWWIITGGMSGGDNPTEMFQPILFANQIGVFEEPFTNGR